MKTPLKRFLNIMFVASLIFMFTALEADAKRGVRFQDTEGEAVGFYQNSYALVVGASAYRSGWPKLPGVVDDIKTVSKALKKQGFAVRVIRDPDHSELKDAFNDFINSYGHRSNNRLLFYFAGHGHTLHLTYGADMGYIVPVDAPNPDVDKSGFLAKALDMQQFEVYARRIESNHALFLFDSCFSGSIFALERAIPSHISYKTARPVRQFITSGSADETVPDVSIFRHQFIEALDGEADVNEDGYITGSELGEYLFEKVVNYSSDSQHPQYGKIRDMYLDKGDFVFLSASSGAIVEKHLKGRLYVDTEPEGARVRILNIKPKYSRGMALDPGGYHIEVTAEGYETERRWIDLAAGHEQPFSFELAKPISLQKVITNSIGMRFNLIPSGTFKMGSKLSLEEFVQKYGGEAKSYKREHPLHEVKIREPFSLQTTEVTVGQWRKFIKETGYKTEAETDGGAYIWDDSEFKKKKGTYWDNPEFSQDDRHPVTCVSWNDVQEFIRWLNRKEGTDKYRLPTEAEWEYAIRAGNATVFTFGDDAGQLAEYAWYYKNSEKRTHPVGTKEPNPWGLFDMHGNVSEWAEDDFHDTYDGTPSDGSAWIDEPRGASRMIRGGAWVYGAHICRSTFRMSAWPDNRVNLVGFRLARSVTPGSAEVYRG